MHVFSPSAQISAGLTYITWAVTRAGGCLKLSWRLTDPHMMANELIVCLPDCPPDCPPDFLFLQHHEPGQCQRHFGAGEAVAGAQRSRAQPVRGAVPAGLWVCLELPSRLAGRTAGHRSPRLSLCGGASPAATMPPHTLFIRSRSCHRCPSPSVPLPVLLAGTCRAWSTPSPLFPPRWPLALARFRPATNCLGCPPAGAACSAVEPAQPCWLDSRLAPEPAVDPIAPPA